MITHTLMVGAEGCFEFKDVDWMREATSEEIAQFRDADPRYFELTLDTTGRPYFPMTVIKHLAPAEAWDRVKDKARVVRPME